jgi:hypothetical protein
VHDRYNTRKIVQYPTIHEKMPGNGGNAENKKKIFKKTAL